MKLFSIGDSLTQGFMSLAAARTDLSYSTLIARALGLETGSRKTAKVDYYYPEWPKGGHPANVEDIFRRLHNRFGNDIRGLEWVFVLSTLNGVLDKSEDYYERGAGDENTPYFGKVPHFHNVAVRGFNVADSWMLTPEEANKQISMANKNRDDDFLGTVQASYYRTALSVLNPNRDPSQKSRSQLDWLAYHAQKEGVENLVLWLGSNNALGTVLSLDVKQTPGDPSRPVHEMIFQERQDGGWNLWHPDDFRLEYAALLDRIEKAMVGNKDPDWQIFVGTVPFVTIAPLAKGVGPEKEIPGKGVYYKYYTYFPFTEKFAHKTGVHLTMQEALHIDDCIRVYNHDIKQMITERNNAAQKAGGPARYHIVDTSQILSDMALKRNNGLPKYEFPPYFDHIFPKVNTKYYHADKKGRLRQGGIFSLDGVHPTAIGQALLAHEFIKVMKSAGVAFKNEIDWPSVFASDRLYQQPIPIMQELYQHEKLVTHVIKLIQCFEDK